MNNGDYIRAKSSFSRLIYIVSRNNNSGEIIYTKETDTINFIENKKYLITNRFIQFNEELIEIQTEDNHKVCFSINKIEGYECVTDLFIEDISQIRLKKIIHLNNIISDIEQYIYE